MLTVASIDDDITSVARVECLVPAIRITPNAWDRDTDLDEIDRVTGLAVRRDADGLLVAYCPEVVHGLLKGEPAPHNAEVLDFLLTLMCTWVAEADGVDVIAITDTELRESVEMHLLGQAPEALMRLAALRQSRLGGRPANPSGG